MKLGLKCHEESKLLKNQNARFTKLKYKKNKILFKPDNFSTFIQKLTDN